MNDLSLDELHRKYRETSDLLDSLNKEIEVRLMKALDAALGDGDFVLADRLVRETPDCVAKVFGMDKVREARKNSVLRVV